MLVTNLWGQGKTNSTKKLVLVIALVDTGKCEYKALKILGDSVMIDTCFNNQTNSFTNDQVKSVNDNFVFLQLQSLTGIKVQQMQTSLDSVRYCDYATPYMIQVNDEKNELESFSLKRFSNCYPMLAKQFMEMLDNYFRRE
jgi:hypothetical protein